MLRIISFKIKDFQRIELASAELDPESGMITVSGPNEQGKSAFLNAITSAITKTPRDVQTPVHIGEQKAFVRLVLGEKKPGEKDWQSAYTVDRMWEKDASGKVTSSLRVLDNRTLKTAQTPAELLKSLIGDTIIDPVDFVDRTSPAEQRAILMRICQVDTDAIDTTINELQARDTQLKSEQTAAEVNVSRLPHHPDVDATVEIDISTIMAEINSLNAQKSAALSSAGQAQVLESRVASCRDAESKALEAYENAKRATAEAVAAAKEYQSKTGEVSALIEKLDTQIADAQMRAQGSQLLNSKIRDNIAKAAAREQWLKAESLVAENLTALKEAKETRLAMLQAADFPIPKLSVGPTYIEYDGLPFLDQSRARKILIATAIATHRDANLKVVLIRDAAVMDKALLCELAQMCQARGAQLIVEIKSNRTDDGGYDELGDITFDGGVIVEVANAKTLDK